MGIGITRHYHFYLFRFELPDNGRFQLVRLLRVQQLVAVLRDDRLHLTAVRRLLVEFLVQLKRDRRVLYRRVGRQHVLVVVGLGQLHHRRYAVADLPGYHTDACKRTKYREERVLNDPTVIRRDGIYCLLIFLCYILVFLVLNM